jgi:inorganic pyrophosphatase
VVDPRFNQVMELSHVPPHLLREIEHFFHVYKDLENKHVETFGWQDRGAAEALIQRSIQTHH